MSGEAKFNFNLFETQIVPVLRDCNYINLPIELPGVIDEVNFLLTKCGSIFYQENIKTSDLKSCEAFAKTVLDIVWEKINTGHWKDVDPNWRYAFTFASLFKVLCLLAKKDSDKIEIIKACDTGLLMGAPLMRNILSKIASKLSTILSNESGNNRDEPKAKQMKYADDTKCLTNPVVIEKDLPKESFISLYLEKCSPVVLTGAISDWPALSTNPWSTDYFLNKARFRTVPIELGSKYTDDSWTQKLMTIEDFIQTYILNKSKQKEIGYLAQHNLFDQIPELLDDIALPSYIENESGVDISIYFGPGGTISPLHFDPKYNLLAQVVGEKYIRLYSEEETQFLYPRKNTWLSNTSQVDVENPDLASFPLFSQAKYQECVLGPGDLLHIPPRCWHYVRSLSTSISISFWW
ncbi:hypothetical protein JTE90_013207 [Oedothorax gibbosus]|uniref:JmjC domain-containing protein 5 n=1 Tax=Oedothorax gibbosus TaxID=931172 RepID=A0AAV6ULX0_9ARAC|nr:hypothetical protein JTE90_013207 [Oedothorax gibbosus]